MDEKQYARHLTGLQIKYFVLTVLVYIAVYMFLLTATLYLSLYMVIAPYLWGILALIYFLVAWRITKRIMVECAID